MTTYQGSCHCGTVKFEVRNQEGLNNLMRCNCSLCRRRGAIMATAKISDLVITAGEEQLTLYQWNTRIAKHYFCSLCGIYTHHQRRRLPDQIGFNVACLEGIDLDALEGITEVDGRQFSLAGPAGE